MPADDVVLTAGRARAHIAPFGAELTRWAIGARELLWRPAAAIWDRTSPLLFPVVGWCSDACIRVDGKIYPMPVHGFAANSRFSFEQLENNRAHFVLRDDAVTRVHYPYAFEFSVEYELAETAISVCLSVTNNDDRQSYYACGLHPGFAMPFAGGTLDDYRVEFDEEEHRCVPVITSAGLFSSKRRKSALIARSLSLSRDVFAHEALCFLNARSQSLSLGRPGHGRISLAVDNFRHFAVWSVPGAPFVSLEAWTGHGDPEGFCGELADKPGMIALQPGEIGQHWAVISQQFPD